MGTEVATPKALALAEKINSNQMLIDKHALTMVDLAIESGTYLLELKEALPHGHFMSFCKEHVRVKKSQRENYMIAASAEPSAVIEYKESDSATGGLQGFIDSVRNRSPKKIKEKSQSTGILQREPEPEYAKKELTEEDCRRELEKPMYNRGDGVDLFDFSHAFMNKVNTMFRDKSLRKMTPSEFAELLYEAMTYSDWGQPVEASMIREEIDHIERFTSFMSEVVKHLNKPTVQEVRNV